MEWTSTTNSSASSPLRANAVSRRHKTCSVKKQNGSLAENLDASLKQRGAKRQNGPVNLLHRAAGFSGLDCYF